MDKRKLREIMNLDTIAIAEEVSGSKEESDSLGFALTVLKSQVVKRELKERGDTYHGIPFVDFRRMMIENDFTLIYEEEFEGRVFDGKTVTDIQLIYFKESEGLLLNVDSFSLSNRTVNSGHIYYNWKPELIDASEVWKLGLISSGNWKSDSFIWIGSCDIREGLLMHLDNLRLYGTFVTPWVEAPFIRLLHYMDDHNNGKCYDYHEINKRKLNNVNSKIKESILHI